MFDLAWNELLIIAIVAIVVAGPWDLSGTMCAVTKWVRRG